MVVPDTMSILPLDSTWYMLGLLEPAATAFLIYGVVRVVNLKFKCSCLEFRLLDLCKRSFFQKLKCCLPVASKSMAEESGA